MPLVGGAPREVLENVEWADWSPDGSQLAIVRDVGGRDRLEYPIGKVLYETGGWISHPRISRKGDSIAFLDHPVQGDSIAGVSVVDLTGKKTALTEPYGGGAIGLAWSPNGDEIWFTAVQLGIDRALYAVTLAQKKRLVARVPADLTLQDVLADGRVLLARDNWRRGLIVRSEKDSEERDFHMVGLVLSSFAFSRRQNAPLSRGRRSRWPELCSVSSQDGWFAGGPLRRWRIPGSFSGWQVGALDPRRQSNRTVSTADGRG